MKSRPKSKARRRLLKGLLLGGVAQRPMGVMVMSAVAAGCNSGGDAGAATATSAVPATAPVSPGSPVTPVTPVTVSTTPERYRTGQARLFQSIPAASVPARIPGGSPFLWTIHGATNRCVDLKSGWTWDHPGGDWIDAARVRQGTTPWFSFSANAVAGKTAVFTYSVNVTSALTAIQAENRWCALILNGGFAVRTVAGTNQSTHPKPKIEVTYTDATSATLSCLYSSSLAGGTQLCNSASPTLGMPLALEFEKPAKPVQSATLSLTVVEHWSGSATIYGNIIDPPLNKAPLVAGLAASYGPLDQNLATDPNIIGAHRYLDGTAMADFALPGTINTSGEGNYDPAIFGTGATDLSKLPHLGLGKWINAGSNFSLISSSYRGEGFAPLAPGLGALRVTMPAAAGVTDGTTVGYGGTLGANAKIFLPEPDFGLLKRLFVRYYMRLHSPYDTPFSKRYQVINSGSVVAWSDKGGKTGITPAHDTTYGGVSGSAGGGFGWQMRLAWADCDAEMGGPSENGITMGGHTFDYLTNNPSAYKYGSLDTSSDSGLGQQGGMGGVFYPGYWYCVEMEVDLNTVMLTAPGYVPDGALRVWVDGRLVNERTGMMMRSLPLVSKASNPLYMRPARELGHRDLWFNWFHGGVTQNTIDRVMFVTGLAWGRSYIGPMKLS